VTGQVHIVLEYEDDGVSRRLHVLGVFTALALAKRVAARGSHRVVYTAPMNKELGKAKA
jgi:hypothetical protein